MLPRFRDIAGFLLRTTPPPVAGLIFHSWSGKFLTYMLIFAVNGCHLVFEKAGLVLVRKILALFTSVVFEACA